jgi:hypothetical protein
VVLPRVAISLTVVGIPKQTLEETSHSYHLILTRARLSAVAAIGSRATLPHPKLSTIRFELDDGECLGSLLELLNRKRAEDRLQHIFSIEPSAA